MMANMAKQIPSAVAALVDAVEKGEDVRQRVLRLMERDTPGNHMSEEALSEVINRETHLYRRRRKLTLAKRPAGR